MRPYHCGPNISLHDLKIMDELVWESYLILLVDVDQQNHGQAERYFYRHTSQILYWSDQMIVPFEEVDNKSFLIFRASN